MNCLGRLFVNQSSDLCFKLLANCLNMLSYWRNTQSLSILMITSLSRNIITARSQIINVWRLLKARFMRKICYGRVGWIVGKNVRPGPIQYKKTTTLVHPFSNIRNSFPPFQTMSFSKPMWTNQGLNFKATERWPFKVQNWNFHLKFCIHFSVTFWTCFVKSVFSLDKL